MIKVEEMKKDSQYPKGVDYTLKEFKEFENIYDLLYKKISGQWKVLYIDPDYATAKALIDFELPDYIDMYLFVRGDTLSLLAQEIPSLRVTEKSKKELYAEFIAGIENSIAPSATKELFKRSGGDLELIKKTILKIASEKQGEITLKDIKDNLLYAKKVYARDVVLSALLKGSIRLPRKDNRYSLYHYQDTFKLLDTLVTELGQDYAFYAIRKYTAKLHKEKSKYLGNKEVKEPELMKLIDAYQILNAYVVFNLSNPRQLYTCIKTIMDRTHSGKCDLDMYIERRQ